MNETYKVYVKADDRNRIIAINSSAFIPETEITGWTQIDDGSGDQYHHAQGNYSTDPPLYCEQGIPNYKLVSGEAVERTEEEIQADIDALPPPPKSDAEKMAELEEIVNALLGQ
ncbi:MAG: hypothetical protein ACOX7B_03245 [Christensenellales bacterium]|jgi:hypothetical protein